MLLGAVGPALVLLVMSFFAWRLVRDRAQQSDRRSIAGLESNQFAAQFVAKTVTNELERRYTAVEEMADSRRFQRCWKRRSTIRTSPGCAASSAIPS